MEAYTIIDGYDDFRSFMASDISCSSYPIPNNPAYIDTLDAILNGTRSEHPQCSAPDMVILCCLSKFEELIGEYYATKLTAPFTILDSFRSLVEFLKHSSDNSYIIFMPSEFFSLKKMFEIHNVISACVPRQNVGFFPCGNADLLMHMVTKDLCYNLIEYKDKLSLLRILNKKVPEYSRQSNLTIYNQDSATLENIHKYFNTHFCKVGSFLGHGRDDLFWLANLNVICGKNDYHNVDSMTEHHPACSYCGECFEPGSKRILARDLPIENLFLFSCNSVKPHTSMFSKNYTILYGFLAGYARSVIGTLTTAQGVEPLNIYYIRLLECSLTLGEIVAILNMVNENYCISHAWNFLLIGNPNIKMGDRAKMFEAEYDFTQNKEIKISVDRPDISIIRVYLHGFSNQDLSCYLNYACFILSDNTFVNKMYKLFGYNEHGWYLDFFSCEDIPSMEFDFQIAAIDFSIISSASFLKQAFDFNLRLNNTVDRLNTDLQSRIKKIHKNYHGINSSYANDETVLYSQIIRLKDNVAQQSELMIDALISKAHATGFRWEEFCYENGYKIDSATPLRFGKCPACGGEAFYAKYIHPYYKEYARLHCYCEKCGVVSDEPYILSSGLELSLDSLSCKCGESNTITITIKSKKRLNDPCILGFSLLWGKDYSFSYAGNMQKANFNNEMIAQVTGQITANPLILPHSHPLKIYIMSNGQLYGYRYNLWFDES